MDWSRMEQLVIERNAAEEEIGIAEREIFEMADGFRLERFDPETLARGLVRRILAQDNRPVASEMIGWITSELQMLGATEIAARFAELCALIDEPIEAPVSTPAEAAPELIELLEKIQAKTEEAIADSDAAEIDVDEMPF